MSAEYAASLKKAGKQNPIISAYAPKLKVALKFKGNGRTKQSFKDETDVNNIVARFHKTGDPTPFLINDQVANWGIDVPDNVDYQTAMNLVANAQSAFDELSSNLRNKFDNDAGKYLEFVNQTEPDGSPTNLDEMVKLGMATLPPDRTVNVNVVNETLNTSQVVQE